MYAIRNVNNAEVKDVATRVAISTRVKDMTTRVLLLGYILL